MIVVMAVVFMAVVIGVQRRDSIAKAVIAHRLLRNNNVTPTLKLTFFGAEK